MTTVKTDVSAAAPAALIAFAAMQADALFPDDPTRRSADHRAGKFRSGFCVAMVRRLEEPEGIAAAAALLGRWIGEGLVVEID